MTQTESKLRRCLGPAAITAQAVGTVGLTLTAVINIPQVVSTAGRASWIAYAMALAAIVLVCETLVLFRHQPAQANGIAGYVDLGLGPRAGALASWALMLGYGASFLACLAFFGFYLDRVLIDLGLPVVPLLSYLIGGGLSLLLTCRDVRLSTKTMLLTETISVLIVLALCWAILTRGGEAAVASTLNPSGDSVLQIRSGLMIAVLSFMGFESAANLGTEALRPERAVPRALRTAVLLAGVLFLIWSVLLSEGLNWLPPSARTGLDPISLLAVHLGHPGDGTWIKFGAFLCLLGSTLGCLTALGRVGLHLARLEVLPHRLQRIHPRFQTPDGALLGLGLPAIGIGAGLLLRGLSTTDLYNLLGGFAVLGFLLVYALVASASLRKPLAGSTVLRRRLVGGSCLIGVLAVTIGYLSSVIGQQNELLIGFAALMGLGAAVVARQPSRSASR